MDEAERGLILQARQGDGAAFARLVRPYDRRILGLVLDMVGDAEDAQDVFQEALLAAYRGLAGFRMESEFSTWLYRIAANKALKFRRRRGGTKLREVAAAAEIGPPGRGPEERLLAAELRSQLEQAMERLSGRERLAFALCHRQGFTIDQAAAYMDCSPGAVKSYLFRGREKVKGRLRLYLEV